MIKIFIIGFTTFMLFLVEPFIHFEEKIKIDLDYPALIQPGEEFTMTIHVHKTDINGFARLQQYLPAGCIVNAIEKNGADFTFTDNTIKFAWLNLPVENDFTVSYKIKTGKNIESKQTINGVFVYIGNDKTQRYTLPAAEFNIGKPSIDNAAIPSVSRQLLCISKKPGEYKVILTIHPNTISESAKFTDEIPADFTTELIDAHGASYSFENNSVIFNWKNLPSDTSFIISYFVRSGKTGITPVITGELVYGDEAVTAGQPVMQENPEDQVFASTDAQKNESVIDQEAPMAAVSVTLPDVKNLPVAPNGIVFKIQISATQHSPVRNNNWFTYNYHIESDVELTNHEGWNKYMVGSFQAYHDARDFRNKTRKKVADAFVVAYDNGIRIPVSEALRSKPLNQ